MALVLAAAAPERGLVLSARGGQGGHARWIDWDIRHMSDVPVDPGSPLFQTMQFAEARMQKRRDRSSVAAPDDDAPALLSSSSVLCFFLPFTSSSSSSLPSSTWLRRRSSSSVFPFPLPFSCLPLPFPLCLPFPFALPLLISSQSAFSTFVHELDEPPASEPFHSLWLEPSHRSSCP